MFNVAALYRNQHIPAEANHGSQIAAADEEENNFVARTEQTPLSARNGPEASKAI